MEKFNKALLESHVDNCASILQDLNINKESIRKTEALYKECATEIKPINDEMAKLKEKIAKYEKLHSHFDELQKFYQDRNEEDLDPTGAKRMKLTMCLNSDKLTLKTKEVEAATILAKFDQHLQDLNILTKESLT